MLSGEFPEPGSIFLLCLIAKGDCLIFYQNTHSTCGDLHRASGALGWRGCLCPSARCAGENRHGSTGWGHKGHGCHTGGMELTGAPGAQDGVRIGEDLWVAGDGRAFEKERLLRSCKGRARVVGLCSAVRSRLWASLPCWGLGAGSCTSVGWCVPSSGILWQPIQSLTLGWLHIPLRMWKLCVYLPKPTLLKMDAQFCRKCKKINERITSPTRPWRKQRMTTDPSRVATGQGRSSTHWPTEYFFNDT